MLRLIQIILLLSFLMGCCFISNHVDASEDGLCHEFRELKKSIPIKQLIAITERHFKYDANFRRAIKFLHSIKFAQLASQIERSPFFQSILRQFENAGINASDIATIRSIIDCLMLPATSHHPSSSNVEHESAINGALDKYPSFIGYNEYENDDDYNYEYNKNKENYYNFGLKKNSRTFQSFASEIVQAIPKQRFTAALSKGIEKNVEFREFYKIIRNPKFRSNFFKELTSKSVSQAVRALRHEGIDIQKLMRTIFQLFLLGPIIA